MSELFSGRGEKCSGGGKKNLARFAREIIVPILIFLVPKISRPPLTEILYPPLIVSIKMDKVLFLPYTIISNP